MIGANNKTLIPEIHIPNTSIAGLLNVTADIENVKLLNFSLDNSQELMKLGDNQAVFSIYDLVGHLQFDYSYLTDPPLLADIGSFQLELGKTNFSANFSTDMDTSSGVMQIDLYNLIVNMDDFKLDIDGVSDISLVITDLVNYVGNVLQYRILKILEYLGTERAANFVNILLE